MVVASVFVYPEPLRVKRTFDPSMSSLPTPERLRAAMDANAAFFMSHLGVCGYGVAWREGYPAFVVKAERVEMVGRLRGELPESIEGLPVRIEVGEVPEFIEGEACSWQSPEAGSRSLLRRISSWLTNRKAWLAFRHTASARQS